MEWIKFEGQKLETGDILWLKNDGLAFVDSSLATGEPDRITSIPEAWSWSFSHIDVNKRSEPDYESAHIKKSGWIYRHSSRYSDRVTELKYDKITHFIRVGKPK